MLVKLKAGQSHHALRADVTYLVVGMDDVNYRLNDQFGPCLHEKELFDVLEPTVPGDWVRMDGDDGDWYLDPPEVAAPGFYERWHDDDPVALALFAKVFARLEAEQAALTSR